MKIYDMIEGKWLKEEKKVKDKKKEDRKELELALRLAKHGEKNT